MSTPLERITERVTRLGDPGSEGVPISLLTIAEFFDGNCAIGSIGCNLEGPPSPTQFYELFNQFAQRTDVKDIRIVVSVFDDPAWPFSEAVIIMTTATPDEVMRWFPETLRPDEAWVKPLDDSFEPYTVPDGMSPIYCWWD